MTKRDAETAGGERRIGERAGARMDVVQLSLDTLDSLDEINSRLGTFRLRLSIAHQAEQSRLRTVIGELEARYRQRRAELA